MRQSTRLIVNASSMYGRMAITVGISLLITRLLLRWLGEVDFGLVLTLAATGMMLQFVITALTTAIERHLAYEIGRDDMQRVGRVVSTAWVLLYLVGAGFWVVGELLAPLVLDWLTIPPDRMDAAWWVYQITLLNLVVGVTAAPFQATIVAHQHLTVQACFDFLLTILRLAAVLMLLIVPWDRMITYTSLQLAGFAVVRWSTMGYANWRFPHARPRWRNFDRAEVKRIVGLAGWTVLGNLSWRIRMQGGILLLNVFFGPVVAAYGVAIQVAGYVLSFNHALRLTVMPVIVGAHAKNNRQDLHRLALVTGKYALLLLSLIFVPVWLEAPKVFALWLDEVPALAVELTRFVLIWALTHVFCSGYTLALLSTGDIGWYARKTLLISLAVLVVAGAGFYFGMPPWFLPVVEWIGVFSLLLIAVFGIGSVIELPPARWVREALMPSLAVLVPATTLAASVHWSMPSGIWRLLCVTAAYGAAAAPLIWWVGLGGWERQQFIGFAQRALSRLRR